MWKPASVAAVVPPALWGGPWDWRGNGLECDDTIVSAWAGHESNKWPLTMPQNVSLIIVANGDASKCALIVVAFLPIDHHWHHQRAVAMGGVTRQLECKTTRSCHICGMSICKQHSTVLMTCLECTEGLDRRLPYQQPHQMTVVAAERPDWPRVLWRNSACIYF